jgi:hypothetical protein
MDNTPDTQGDFEFLLLVAESGFDIGLPRGLLTSSASRTEAFPNEDSQSPLNLLVLRISNRN